MTFPKQAPPCAGGDHSLAYLSGDAPSPRQTGVPSKHWPILDLSGWLRMDTTKLSSLFRAVRRSRPAATREIASHPQAITAVVVYFSRAGAPMYVHEKVTLSAVAESIARLGGYQYAGVFDANRHSTGDLFFVPDDTLMLDEARSLGIHSPCQLYGAVVPYPPHHPKRKESLSSLRKSCPARPAAHEDITSEAARRRLPRAKLWVSQPHSRVAQLLVQDAWRADEMAQMPNPGTSHEIKRSSDHQNAISVSSAGAC